MPAEGPGVSVTSQPHMGWTVQLAGPQPLSRSESESEAQSEPESEADGDPQLTQVGPW